MDLYALKCFVNLAETLHFGKAGELSHLSPSALSRAIKRIEDEVGKPLFIRDNRSVSLTRAGELFHIYAREAILNYRSFQETLEAETEIMRGEVIIAASLSSGSGILRELLSPFREAFPRVNVSVMLEDEQRAFSLVNDGGADVAVMLALPDYVPKGVLIADIGETPLVFIAPEMNCQTNELAAQEPRNWAEIPLVVTESDLSRRRLDAWLHGRDIRPKIAAQVARYEDVAALVSLGCGIGVVPKILLERQGFPGIRVLDSAPKLVGFNFGLAALKRRLQHPVVRVFWETATLERSRLVHPVR